MSAVDNYLAEILEAGGPKFLLPYNLVSAGGRTKAEFKTENYLPLSEFLGKDLRPSDFFKLVHGIVSGPSAAVDNLIFCFPLDIEKIYIGKNFDLRLMLEPDMDLMTMGMVSGANIANKIAALIRKILEVAANPELRIPGKKILSRFNTENPSPKNMLRIVEEVLAEWHVIDPGNATFSPPKDAILYNKVKKE